ncbi:hypothetical protein [Vibrio campbellii]|uniref:hypothetical protein n=1 Tax=Vibrio campbellii TaxID=680 RepID=UPI000CD33F75|nr:hypothetical protein [Vibrio campbellii]AUW07442.1 hypothetical protein C1N51_27695 [Vibrio campbellii]
MYSADKIEFNKVIYDYTVLVESGATPYVHSKLTKQHLTGLLSNNLALESIYIALMFSKIAILRIEQGRY